MSTKDAYEVLMERMGFPGSRRLRPIMEQMMSPDQARMALELPGTPQEVAEKTSIDVDRVRDNLDELYFKGVIFPRGDFRHREYFRFARSIGQLHDAVLATRELDVEKDRPLFQLWDDFVMNEMYPSFAERYRQLPGPISRIVPAYRAIKDLPGVLPYENFPEILKAQEMIGVVPCSR